MTKDGNELGTLPVSVWQHALMCVNGELSNGQAKHGPMVTVMDGWARLMGEVDELRGEVHSRDEDHLSRVFDEAVQVAAMAVRLAVTASSPKGVEPT